MVEKKNHRRPILYVQKLIRIRVAIAKKNRMPVVKSALELKKLIDYHKYNSDRLASSFFMRKKDVILQLIPGIRCNSHKALMAEYFEILEYSEQILNNHAIHTTTIQTAV